MKKIKYIFPLLFVLLFQSQNTSAQSSKDTLKVLFVGNSYTYVANMPQIVSLISEQGNTYLLTQKSTKGGATLSQHWNGERGFKTKEMIASDKYDIVVLQDQSMSTIEQPDSVKHYGILLCQHIKRNGAQAYFYQTWARERVPQYQSTISKIYNEVASKNEAGVVRVGDVWEQARQLRPGFELFAPDGSHQSELGAFLTACTFVATLTGELPENLRTSFNTMDVYGESIQLMKVDKLDAIFCKKVVEEVLK